MNGEHDSGNRLVSAYILILIALQPIMDVISYFWAQSGHGNLMTLALRLLVLGAAVVIAFICSEHKRSYLLAAGVCVLFWIVHAVVCLQAGYESPFTDFANYVRVIQIVFYTLCMITMLRKGEHSLQTALYGCCISFGICAVVVLLSVLTGTDPHTYTSGYGVLGWFSTTNSQSSILSALTPVVLVCALRYRGKGSLLVLTAAVLTADALLYFIGTRLAFASLLACAVGLPVVMLLSRSWDLRRALIILLGGVICFACVKYSPMINNQAHYNSAMAEKQGWADMKLQEEASTDDSAGETGGSTTVVSEAEREKQLIDRLTPVYTWQLPELTERFGVETMIRKYNFSENVSEITAARRQKIIVCQLLQEELPFTAKLFGMELGRMTIAGNIYDVENDFYGIWFLYGAVGLLLLAAFLGYFAFLIVRALISDFRRYFTLEAGGVGIALIIEIVYAGCTAGVLRRPNASFYLSLMLALAYALVKLHSTEHENSEVPAV